MKGEPEPTEEQVSTGGTAARGGATEAPPPLRLHDLDALRAFAMLLGIGLHGVLSFTTFAPFGWAAVDRTQWSGFDTFFQAVHGFRMPLFFLLSGFFTAMLWRRRGLGGLLGHRAKRILLPLIFGSLLFVPAVNKASEEAGKTRGVRFARQGEARLQADWSAMTGQPGEDEPADASLDDWWEDGETSEEPEEETGETENRQQEAGTDDPESSLDDWWSDDQADEPEAAPGEESASAQPGDWQESSQEEDGSAPAVGHADLFAATRAGDLEAVRALLAEGADTGVRDDKLATALHYAAGLGHTQVASALLEAGTEVDITTGDNTTPLIWAVLFGQVEVAEVLLAAGADPNLKNTDGSSATGIAAAPWSDLERIVGWVADILELEIDLERVGRDREALPALLEEAGGKVPSRQERELEELFAFLFFYPVFHHLWFLWFLCWMVAGFTVHAGLSRLIGRTLLPNWLFSHWACLIWLVPLTLIPQAFMHGGPEETGFGPDTSAALLPFPHLLLYYGVFFGFGALIFDRPKATEDLGKDWMIILPLALLVLLPYGLVLSGTASSLPSWLPELTVQGEDRAGLNMLVQVLYTWMMSLGLIGLFRRLLRKESRVVRYLSDSSYWLYVAHLPLVIWAQGLVADWDLPAVPKCLLLCASVTAFLLLTYEYCVRYTPIGTLLNGKKVRPAREAQA